MPTYEMPLLVRLGRKAEYASILKEVAESIFATGGFIRKIENWGEKELPCKASCHGRTHKAAGHFMLCFDAPPSLVEKIIHSCKRNINIIRSPVYLNETSDEVPCTFEEEMLPPPYRPSVQQLIEIGKRQKRSKTKFKYNSGLDYYPFMR